MTINGLHAYDSTTNGSGSSTSTSSSASTNGLNPNDFMSLLVAEIQNQDRRNRWIRQLSCRSLWI